MNTVKHNSLYAWVLASRPKTLTGAIIPVMIGTALAVRDNCFQACPAIVCTLFACLMQIAANFINDLFDYLKGTDREDRLGPERACAQGWISPRAMKAGILLTVTIACLLGCTLLFYAGWELIIIGLLCAIFAFLYTTCLSYNGWGDILVIVFFGFVPVGGTYYVQSLSWNSSVTIISLACGLVIDTLLVVNNYRDRKADALSGKRTIIVRFGEKFGELFYLLLGLIASLLCTWFITQNSPYAGLLPLIYLIPHFITWKRMIHINNGKELNRILGETSRNMLLFGILLSIGLLLT